MTFSAQGTREGMVKKIREIEVDPKDSQGAAVKAFLAVEVNSLPDEFNGCRVDASWDVANAHRVFQSNIIPQKLEV
jgi:hypothetical protein